MKRTRVASRHMFLVCVSDREQEAEGCEDERDGSADRALEHDRPGDRRALAGMAARRLVDPRRRLRPPVGSTWPTA